jgi:hypothetical protein
MHNYSEIPDDIRTKPYMPLGKHIWRIFKALGMDYVEETIDKISGQFLYDLFRIRMDETIQTAKYVMDGEIPHPDKALSYMLFPPVVPIRADLNQGSTKLIYGGSTDVTFVCPSDLDEEIFFLLNGHCEDGIPVDWWFIGPEDDTLDRRHLKLGFKLREMTKRFDNLLKAGEKLLDVLKDMRNERTPQWADSAYIICMVWSSGVLNFVQEPSSYEGFAGIWDGISAKKLGLPDTWMSYIPWPSFLNMLIMGGRDKWTLSLCGLSTEHRIYFMPLEQKAVDWISEEFPELWNVGVVEGRQMGIPYPWQTLNVRLPEFKKKETYEKEKFDFEYPSGEFITPDGLDMTVEDTYRGIYLDVTHDTPKSEKATRDHVISVGLGKDTEYIK